MQATSTGQPRWLLFLHQLPPKPDYLRVKVRRRLQRLGAVALRNAVYVLPLVPDAVEDFRWLRREIVDAGGEATLCASELLEGVSDADIEALLRAERNAEYEQVLEAVRALGAQPAEHDVARLRRQLRQVVARDYMDAPGRQAAEQALAAIETIHTRTEERASASVVPPAPHNGATWVTRQNVYVDRIASAWLIARFIDRGALFKFVPARGYQPVPGELRFDMFEGEYTHEGDRCTFETLLRRFALDDAALDAIACIVHDIDMKDDKFERDETDGVQTVLEGIARGLLDDDARLTAGRTVFDGLYEHFRHHA